MPTKQDLEETLGVILGLIDSTDPDDKATATRYIKKMKRQVEALEETKEGVITTGNPWKFAVQTGTRFGGKYVVRERLSPTKHIYLCSHTLFQDQEDHVENEVVVKCTFLSEGMDAARIKMIMEQEKRAVRAISVDVSRCPYSVGLIDAGELTTPEGQIVAYWQAFANMNCDANKLQSIMGGYLPPFMVMQAARQIIEVLLHYHMTGILHRDIKPHNLLCEWPTHESLREIWKLLVNFALTDAGLVTGTVLDTSISEAGMLLGTPQYMSPEQIQDPRKATAASDIWSLAVTLYELATGEFPHPVVKSKSDLHAIIYGKPKLFSAHAKAANYPPLFQRLMDRSLSMSPQERPSTYDWFKALLPQDARMSLAFEADPFPLLGQGIVEPPN